MKIKQHKEKLEIIRNIIRETLLGNAALVVLVSMIIVLCRQEWTFISMLFTGALFFHLFLSSSGLLRLYKFI
ncbi:toxin ArtA [Escherichia coli]|uniref:toxin ArtA n=1 Tax=Escherichia coli TaxID=562 RepID=UPI002F2D59E9|nr:toxin ArtA [Escherichia coli]